jgi:two-component system heavy metal sensor histidine kinase CusS
MSSGEPARASWSIATRLTLWYAAAAFVLVAVATGSLYWVLARSVERHDDQFLADNMRIVRGLLRERPRDDAALRQEVEWEGAVRRYARVYICILDESRNILMETPGSRALMKPHPVAAADVGEDLDAAIDFVTPAGAPMRLVAAWAQVGNGPERRLIKIALDRTEALALLGSYRTRLWVVLGLSLLAAAAVGAAIARRGLQPLHAITATARGIGSHTLDRRIRLEGLPAELSTLAETFNHMMLRLQDAFARLTSLSAALAHELRTPVNNMRGEVEVSLGKPRAGADYRETLESVLEECVALSNMIDALMFLARAENPDTRIDRAPFDVCAELKRVTEFHEPAAAEKGVSLSTCDGTAPVRAFLDRTLFQRALSNLITNAIRHTGASGRIVLSCRPVIDALEVTVRDTGEGIPGEHLARVGDRFYRVDSSRTHESGGLGVGLASVKSIVAAHGGSVTIDSTQGQGTTVRLTFPEAVVDSAMTAH